ncbi:hypothetical protein EMCRGX_G010213 [Ephydatia muelleri]
MKSRAASRVESSTSGVESSASRVGHECESSEAVDVGPTSNRFREWFVRCDICSDANKWNDETKAVKLPKLLEGEALASWLELSAEVKKSKPEDLVEGSGPKWEETVSWFWVAVQGFTSEDMSKFLQFVTGSSRLPES